MKLGRSDWEGVLRQTNHMIKDAMINLEILEITARQAKEEIAKFPEEAAGKSEQGQSEVRQAQA